MAVEDLKVTLNRDAFNNPDIDKKELFRRLNDLVEFIWAMMEQIKGDTIVNNNISITGQSSPLEAPVLKGAGDVPIITKVAFNVDGTTCYLQFIDGKLKM